MSMSRDQLLQMQASGRVYQERAEQCSATLGYPRTGSSLGRRYCQVSA
jgi:hypothetical protein